VVQHSRQQIIDDITAHIRNCGGEYHEWYIGTSIGASDELFERHHVLPGSDDWIHREAESPQAAREVLEFFETTYGIDATRDPRHDPGVTVYAYRKTQHTQP